MDEQARTNAQTHRDAAEAHRIAAERIAAWIADHSVAAEYAAFDATGAAANADLRAGAWMNSDEDHAAISRAASEANDEEEMAAHIRCAATHEQIAR